MATDFRFNGQQSYSPLLAALANAPVQKAQLAIQQEQNQRQRLSDLLTNISSAAATARNVQLIHQQQSVIQGQQKMADLATKSNPLAGAAAQANPDAYSTGLAGVTAPFQGLDAMMSGPTAQPSLAGEGVTPNNQDPNESRKAAIMNRVMPLGYELSTNPDTGYRELVSKIPGVPKIPIDQEGNPPNGLKTDAATLNPVERKAIPEFVSKFAEDSKTEQEVLLNAKEFRNLAASKNPVSDTTLKLLTPRLTGIVARLNPTTLDAFGGSPAVLDKINAGLQRAKSGTLTDTDRGFLTDFANTVEGSANDALKQKLSDAVSKAQVTIPGVHASLLSKAIGGDISDRISKYKPMVKAPLSINDVKAPKIGTIDEGHRFKGGDPGEPKNWVKIKS